MSVNNKSHRISFRHSGRRMKPAKIREKIHEFLDQCPETSDVEGMLKDEFKWIQRDGMIAILHHLRKNPPLEIHGNYGSAKNLKLWRVSVTPEVHEKLLDITVLCGCSMSHVLRQMLNDGRLIQRNPILPKGIFKKFDGHWYAELDDSGKVTQEEGSGLKVTLVKRNGSEKLVILGAEIKQGCWTFKEVEQQHSPIV